MFKIKLTDGVCQSLVKQDGVQDCPFRLGLEVLNQQIDSIAKESDRVANEVKELGAARSDLIARKEDIERRMKYTDQLGVQLNAAEVDVVRPNQVELLGVRELAP